MEGGNSNNNNGRPIRTTSRYYSSHPTANFSGPVRKWQKKWVHVAPSQPSIKNPRFKPLSSNAHKLLSSPTPTPPTTLLCKWTPLFSDTSVENPRRKFRYTPIAVVDQKKLMTKKVSDQDVTEKTRHPVERLAMDSDGGYGMLDMNNDLTESEQGTSMSPKISQYSRRSQMSHGSQSEKSTEAAHEFWLMK